MAYNDIVERSGSSKTAREIPESVASGILKEAVEGSAVLKLARTFRMPAYQHRVPVLKSFATAFWLNGANQAAKDVAHKQTTTVTWDNVYLTPDELAVLVPVPDSWMADSNIGWSEIKQEVVRAFAEKIDQAILFGDGSPPIGFSGPVGGLVGGAVAAGNAIVIGSTTSNAINDIALDIGAVARDLDEEGFDVDGFAARRGFHWRFTQHRTTTGETIFTPPTEAGGIGSLFGAAYTEVKNGAWDNTEALMIAGSWDDCVVGIRQDMTFTLHDEGIIQDPATGDIIYNAMQQDGKVLRAVMRLGYAVPTTIKKLGGTFPFGVLRPAGAS
jgi:HK97 family phage major capsid protein